MKHINGARFKVCGMFCYARNRGWFGLNCRCLPFNLNVSCLLLLKLSLKNLKEPKKAATVTLS